MPQKTFIFIIAILLQPSFSYASEKEYAEIESRFRKFHVSYQVNDDFTVERISEYEIKALNDKAAKNLRNRNFSYSTSIEKLEILEAYTLKSDGRKIEVPKGNYQININKGKGENSAIFSDRTKVTIVFPDLESNDSVYMKIKNTETEPMFPENFSASQSFWSQSAYDDVKVSFDLPEKLTFLHETRAMVEKIKTRNGRKIIELTYTNKKPIKIKRDNFSVLDESKEAGYALSTFTNYESIAKAYGHRATPKSIPTKRIINLSKEIISKEKNKKEQARLLYNWVTKNISYAGNCIGIGAVVPHDTDFILDNKMGDCKDHATLLEALYNAVDIESTQALINSGSNYTLPNIPTVASVNHVINYLPEWDKFVDSTNQSLPFDLLAFSVSDKPVILVDGFQQGRKTPPTPIGSNYQKVESTMKIQLDGSVTGNISIEMKGQPAVSARGSWRHVTKEQEDQWLKTTFSSKNKLGSAVIQKDDPEPLLSQFNYSLEFNKPEFILSKGTGGFYVGPLIPTPLSVYALLNYPVEEIEGYDTACSNGHSTELLNYEFPDNIKILAKPENFEIKENHISFSATYKLEGSRLKITREVNDQTPGNVCSEETTNLQRQTLMKISDHMRSQVIYQN